MIFWSRRGSFSRVVEGHSKETNQPVAIKIVSKMADSNPDMLKNEIEILLYVNHPYIIRCYDFFENEKNLYIVMELYKQTLGFSDFFLV